jgi:cytoskeletal protein CcmA (bactofilin family)
MKTIDMLKRRERLAFDSPDRVNRLVEGTKITGDIVSESNIRIDGTVEGNVNSDAKIVIGEKGTVTGNIHCADADVEGTLHGDAHIEGVLILREKATIHGDINTVRIHIEEGASFNGACRMTRQPSPVNNLD